MEPAAWAAGLPAEWLYWASEVFGSWLEAPVISSYGEGQLVEYAAATRNSPIEEAAHDFVVDANNIQMRTHDMFKETATKFTSDLQSIKRKIHRYPATIRGYGDSYAIPRMVAIGPYHHDRDHLKPAETVKHVAAYHCIRESGRSIQEVYDAVVSAAHDARFLYDKDVMAGIADGDFLPMMFYDACFLVQFMVVQTQGNKEMDPSLCSFFDLNRKVIRNDVMLLENQLPWRVVEILMGFRPVSLREFVAPWRKSLQARRKVIKQKPFVLDDSYEPPHLLGLIRHYIVGSRKITEVPTREKIESLSFSLSAMELAEIGITLTANETAELINMGLNKKGIFFAELSLAPLSLNHLRASRIINMAAVELCTTPRFLLAEAEDSAVCSYLRLLSMLVHREEDVHELRTKGILQGGAGLNDKEALDLFTSLQSLPIGSCYAQTMVEIERYRVNRRMQTKVHAFIHKRKKAICTVLSTIVAVVTIFGTLVGILVKLRSFKDSH